eukprot:scaffold35157_cov61-Phaeocystis_antarctica.AAC.1
MRTSRRVAEKLGAIRQDPDLDGLLFGLISRATGGCHEHAARLDHIHVVGAGRGLKPVIYPPPYSSSRSPWSALSRELGVARGPELMAILCV